MGKKKSSKETYEGGRIMTGRGRQPKGGYRTATLGRKRTFYLWESKTKGGKTP